MTKAYFKTRIDEVCNSYVPDSSQDAKEMSPKDASRQQRKVIEGIKLQLVFLLEDLQEDGLLNDTDGVIAGVLNEQILKISSEEQIKAFGKVLFKSLDDNQHIYKLWAAESIRGGIKQGLDARIQGLSTSNKELIIGFAAFNPKDASNIDVYYKTAQQAAKVLLSAKASEGDINAVIEYLAQEKEAADIHLAILH